MVEKDKFVRGEVAPEAAYEGGGEHEAVLSLKRDFPDSDLQARATENVFSFPGFVGSNPVLNPVLENKAEKMNRYRNKDFWGLPKLKRTCSNIETDRADQDVMSPIKSSPYNDIRNLAAKAKGDPLDGISGESGQPATCDDKP